MSKQVEVRAVKAFNGVEGSWTKGTVRTVDADRARSLKAKGLAVDNTDDAIASKAAGTHETKPAPGHSAKPAPAGGNRAPKIPNARPAPGHSTKGKAGKGAAATTAAAKPDDKAKGGKGGEDDSNLTDAAEAITVAEGEVQVAKHRHGKGDKAFIVPAATFKGEPDTVYSVFAFRNGEAPIAVTGEEAVEAAKAKEGAVFLDAVRIPAASGNE